MIRIIFGVLLFGHALIHIIGFASEWTLLPSFLKQFRLLPLSDTSAKVAGTVWLITAMLWLTTTILYFLRKDYLWKVALVTAVLSQLLIIFYWPYGEWGTFVNILVFGLVTVNLAKIKFDRMVENEWSSLIVASGNKNIAHKVESPLPPVVTKWLSASKSTGKIPSRVILTQRGAMRSKPSGEWMHFSAIQYYTFDPPAFLWNSEVKGGSLTAIAARDKFENGKGNMLIKPFYIFTLANKSGEEMDQGAMLRFMGEVVWIPEAARMDYFHWKALDSTSAELSMTYNGKTALGVFTFDGGGMVKSFCAERFGDFDGQFRKETWEVTITEQSTINGHVIGSKCDVTWKLKEGDFTWLKLEVTGISYEYD